MSKDREKAVLMLKTGKGQIDAALKMIENGRYCVDIMNQILAAEALIKKANNLILKQHLDHCVKASFAGENKNDAEEKAQEIVELINKLVK